MRRLQSVTVLPFSLQETGFLLLSRSNRTVIDQHDGPGEGMDTGLKGPWRVSVPCS